VNTPSSIHGKSLSLDADSKPPKSPKKSTFHPFLNQSLIKLHALDKSSDIPKGFSFFH